MRSPVLAMIALAIVSCGPAAESDALSECRIAGFATIERDIRLRIDPREPGEAIKVPEPAQEATKAAIRAALSAFPPDVAEAVGCGETLDGTYRLDDIEGRELYLTRAQFPLGRDIYVAVAYDPVSKTAGAAQAFEADWTESFGFDGFGKPPVFRIEQPVEDGPEMLVFAERAHNGDVYNAIVERYFEVGADHVLRQVMAVESRAAMPGTPDYTLRSFEGGPGGTLLVTVERGIEGGELEPQGSYRLIRSKPGEVFRVAGAKAEQGVPLAGIVTFCGTRESIEEFMQKGCAFYY
ncbi:hypothetical protein [Parerythrobacter lacustris]|uniref:Uncharacterized protein n=1 Tax=Parerythrobacter lacustris TaxID=2969984 RepID=A0ABT1XTQ0_9SPHN|nr:hypothetical protein [Parerythrobacter lacustris]MCR2835045.1 hypothetical protein [Parerythrobacter lacustris]